MQAERQFKLGGHGVTKGVLSLGAALLLIAVGAAQAGASEASTPAAQRALDTAVEAVSTPGGAALPVGEDATLALRDLALSYPDLRGADRRQAKALLQRPPVGQEGPAETDLGSGWNVPEAPNSPACTKHFCVHFVNSSSDAPPQADSDGRRDGDGIPDYVEKTQKTVEETYAKENKKLGWRDPKPDGTKGGNNKVDVYLSQIGNIGLFGYANTDPNEAKGGNRRYAYLVLDNDYKEFKPLTPLKALQVTVAHEYNHILQFGIDFHQQLWMFEASATWMEEKVYPAVSDWLRYVPAFAASTAEPLTRGSAGQGLKIYGDSAFLHYLSRGAGLGPDVVRDAWEKSPQVKPKHFASSAFGASIRKNKGSSFAKEFSKFAAATAEWNAGKKLPDAKRLPQVSRAGKLSVGDRKKTKLDHLAYEVYNVKPRNSDKLTLSVKAQKGTQSAIALVGRKGSRKAGRTKTNLVYLSKGGKDIVRLKDAQRYDRITAVISNSDGRAKGTNSLGSHGFGGDNSDYTFKLSRSGAGAIACRCRK